jgi:hypothetical protein
LKNLNSIGDPFKDLGFIFPISDGTLLLKLVLHGKFPNSDKSKNSQNLNILKPPYSIKANPRFNPSSLAHFSRNSGQPIKTKKILQTRNEKEAKKFIR